MDNMVKFASNFLQIDGEMEVCFDGEFNDKCCGYVEYEPDDDEIVVYINPSYNRQEIITTFFHEMVHVKQYLKGTPHISECTYIIWTVSNTRFIYSPIY